MYRICTGHGGPLNTERKPVTQTIAEKMSQLNLIQDEKSLIIWKAISNIFYTVVLKVLPYNANPKPATATICHTPTMFQPRHNFALSLIMSQLFTATPRLNLNCFYHAPGPTISPPCPCPYPKFGFAANERTNKQMR